jgi:hypothetical protein
MTTHGGKLAPCGQIICFLENLKHDLKQLLIPVIPATWEAEMGRILHQKQPGQKVIKKASQPIAGCGGRCISSQPQGKHK